MRFAGILLRLECWDVRLVVVFLVDERVGFRAIGLNRKIVLIIARVKNFSDLSLYRFFEQKNIGIAVMTASAARKISSILSDMGKVNGCSVRTDTSGLIICPCISSGGMPRMGPVPLSGTRLAVS